MRDQWLCIPGTSGAENDVAITATIQTNMNTTTNVHTALSALPMIAPPNDPTLRNSGWFTALPTPAQLTGERL